MLRKLIIPLFCILGGPFLYSGGMEESSSGNIAYHAGRGMIVKPGDVVVSSIISDIDYRYPDPPGEIGVTVNSGNRIFSREGGEELFLIGLQGSRLDREELPPLNLCFVIDHSGSMASDNKMDWVHESFRVLMGSLRAKDFISIVQFDDEAEVVLPTSQVGENGAGIMESIASIEPSGGTNLSRGLELGYQQVLANYREEYTNRVIFMTDGQGNSGGMADMARSFNDMGIYVTTVGLGEGFNRRLLRDIAIKGGGTARFISDRERMIEMFGEGFSRMVVPVARDINLEVELLNRGEVIEDVSFRSEREGRLIRYYYPALHAGDYETIVLDVKYPAMADGRMLRIGGTYRDPSGNERSVEPILVTHALVDGAMAPEFYSNAAAIHVDALLEYSRALEVIGGDYYRDFNEETGRPGDLSFVEGAIARADRARKKLINAGERLDLESLEEQAGVLANYIGILGALVERDGAELTGDPGLPPGPGGLSLDERVRGMFDEMALDMGNLEEGPVLLSGFSFRDNRPVPLVDYLDSMTELQLSGKIPFPLVNRRDLDAVLEQQKLTLSGLFETERAIEIGRILSSRYMVTGTLIEMEKSLLVFTRIIDIQSSEIISVYQFNMEKKGDVEFLLKI